MLRPGLLSGKRILITGGGTGLGLAMAGAFLDLGADLVIAGRRGGVLKDAAAALVGAHGGKVETHAVDIRDAAAVETMIAAIWTNGPLDGLVNNAAGNFISRTKDLSSRGFDAVANTVLHGTFYVTHAVGRRWIEEGRRGSILSILVTWVWTGSPYVVPSAMSKAGLHVMTKSLAVEWAPHGVRLNAIAPGPFPTEGMSARLNPGQSAAERSAARNPMGRIGEMSELCNLAAFLMGDGCGWLTGQTIALDGGASLAGAGTFYDLRGWTDTQWSEARTAIRKQDSRDRGERPA
jgi:NAD(P)-dependent dehydrogenase (short-subunit alcohol dehydrogenase family)